MHALQGFAILLTLQSLGEALSRLLHLPYPGPVVGMVLLLALLRWPPVRQSVAAAAGFLLQHLSLLFVPVAVGVIAQTPLLLSYGPRLLLALVVSTWVGLAVTAWTLQWLLRRTPDQPPADTNTAPDHTRHD